MKTKDEIFNDVCCTAFDKERHIKFGFCFGSKKWYVAPYIYTKSGSKLPRFGMERGEV